MRANSEQTFSLDDAISSFESQLERAPAGARPQLANFLPSAAHPLYLDTLVELIRVDMEVAWSNDYPTQVADYVAEFPVLRDEAESLGLLCFEEFRQRLIQGQPISAAYYRQQFGINTEAWRTGSQSTHSSHVQTASSLDGAEDLPTVGETFLDYELIRELGRGTFARVFLARQVSLAHRFVALKVTRNRFSDAATLARLQHTNIIPVYSVQRHGDWEAICMPYFGSVTVRHWLGLMQEQKSVPVSARFLFDTIRDKQAETVGELAELPGLGDRPTRHSAPPTRALPSRPLASHPVASNASSATQHDLAHTRAQQQRLHALSDLDYTQTVLLLAKKVASGLAYAHQRGIIHRDLKPANILIADDGEPLILDFNLSQDQSVTGLAREQLEGGTLPYMAPEQLMALEQQSSMPGDARSDLYSFGIILYELLVGRAPFVVHSGQLDRVIQAAISDRRQGAAAIESQSPAINSIVQKCLAFAPQDRYQTAQQVVDDLDCELNSLPLRTARNRSLIERGRKWVRRHPQLVSGGGILTLATVLLLLIGSVLWVRTERLARFEAQMHWDLFQQKRQAAQLKLTSVSLADTNQVDQAIEACDDALSVLSPRSDQNVESAPLASTISRQLDSAQRQQLDRDIAELYFLKATSIGLKAEVTADEQQQAQYLASAIRCNQQAQAYAGDHAFSRSLDRQRRWLQREPLNLPQQQASTSDDGSNVGNHSVRELCEMACLLSAERRFGESIAWWDEAVRRDPQNLWVWYGLGYALQQTKQEARAAECYSVCVALDPERAQWFFDRGLMRLRLGEYALSAADFSQAVTLADNSPETRLNWAIALVELQQYQQACQQLEQVIHLGLNDPQVHLLLARAQAALGETDAAAASRSRAATCLPMRADSWVARGVATAATDPQAAISDFDQALKCEPYCYEALESKASVYAEILGQQQAAIDTLNVAVQRFPESGQLRALRGVLHSRLDHRDDAIADAQSALSSSGTPSVDYCVAGIYANLSAHSAEYGKKATELLASSLKAGYGSDLLDTDRDLAAIRQLPDFQRLVSAAAELQRLSTEPDAAESNRSKSLSETH